VPKLNGRDFTNTIWAWVRADHDAVTAETTFDFDLTNKLTPVKTKGTLVLPKKADSLIRTSAYLHVYANPDGQSGSMNYCWATLSKPSTSGDQIDYETEYANITDLGEVYAWYLLQVPAGNGDWTYSSVQKKGFPQDGEVVDGVLDSFLITSPGDPLTAYPVLSPVEFSTADTGTRSALYFTSLDGSRVVWWVDNTETGAKSITAPKLPSSVDAAVLGTDELYGRVRLLKDFDAKNLVHRRWVHSDRFLVKP
jgi:hypothetical protein